MRKFMSRAIVTLVIGAMLTGNASAVSAKELYDARHVCTDVEAGGLDAAVQDAVKQKVIEYNAKDLEVVTRWGAEAATDEEGNYKVTFSKQYSQIFYCIPAEVDVNKLVSVEVETDAEYFSMKLCAERDNFASAIDVYGATQLNTKDIKADAKAQLSEVSVIGFMNLLEGELTKTVGKVRFTVEEGENGSGDVDVSDKNEFTYDASKLEILSMWGTDKEVSESGKLKVTFPKQYNQVFFKIPDEIDMNRFLSATVDTDRENLSVKLCLADDKFTEAGIVYGNNTITAENIEADKENARVLCLMSLSETELVKEIGSITFKLEPKAEENVKTEFKYNMADLEQKAAWGVDVEEEAGAHKLTYKSQYAQMFYVIPEEVDMTRIEYVSVDLDSTDEFSVKLCAADDDFTEAAVVYGSNVLRDSNLNGNVPKSEIKILDLMSLTADTMTKTVKSVTFKLKEPSPVEVNDGSFKQCYKDKANNNPITTQRYSADPSVMVYNGRVYVYATNDV